MRYHPFVHRSLRFVDLSCVAGDSLAISTPYYSAKIPIWHDQIPLSTNAITEWETEWRSDEAGEVVQSIGAWVVAIQKPAKKDDLVRLSFTWRTKRTLPGY